MSGVPNTAKAWYHWTVAHSGLPWLVRHTLQRSRVTIVIYHKPEPETLVAHLDFMHSRYSIVGLRDVVAWLRGENDSLPPRALVVTLDDGWSCNRRLESAFRDHGVVPTVFVCTSIVGTRRRFWWQTVPLDTALELKRLDDSARLERLAAVGFHERDEVEGRRAALSDQDVRAMQGWADIQSHTRFHPMLPRCDDDRAWNEIAGSLEDLRSLVDTGVYALAYPDGAWSARETQMAQRAGYGCALTIDEGFVRRGDDLYRLRRVGIEDAASRDELAVRLSGIHYVTRDLLRSLGILPRPRHTGTSVTGAPWRDAGPGSDARGGERNGERA